MNNQHLSQVKISGALNIGSFFLLVTLLLGCKTISSRQSGQLAFQAVLEAITNGSVSEVRLYYIPYEVDTRIPVKPGDMRRRVAPSATLQVTETIRKELAEAVLHSTAYSLGNNDNQDVRLGIVLCSKEGKELHSIYLGRPYLFAKRLGVIDGSSVKIQGGIIQWAERYGKHPRSADQPEAAKPGVRAG